MLQDYPLAEISVQPQPQNYGAVPTSSDEGSLETSSGKKQVKLLVTCIVAVAAVTLFKFLYSLPKQ
jgi:hypothetical protein